MAKAFSSELGGGDEIRFLSGLTSVNSTTGARKRYLLAGSGGVLYYGENSGTMSYIGGGVTFVTDRSLSVAERGQKLFIADNSDVNLTGTDGTIAANGTTLDAAGVADWTAHTIDVNSDVVVITAGTGNVVNGTYKISSLAVGNLTLASSVGGAGNCTYTIEAAPKVIDGTNHFASPAHEIWFATTGKGEVPTGCTSVCLYMDRLVLAKGHVWYMSRSGDPLDWQYAKANGAVDYSDVGRAIAGNNCDAGEIGEPVNAMIPFTDDHLVFGCDNSLWVLKGDPAMGGRIDDISLKVGIIHDKAWCVAPAGELVFMSRNGLYLLESSASSPPIALSAERIPEEFLDIDTATTEISMSYDTIAHGIHIHLTPVSSGSGTHWWFDWHTKSFWKATYPAAYQPFACCDYRATDPANNAVILGGRDGYLRLLDDAIKQDDGANKIDSYVYYGPMRLGSSNWNDGLLAEMIAVLDENSDDAKWSVMVGQSCQAAVGASAFKTGTWIGDLNYAVHPRARGFAAYVKVETSAIDTRWAVERITLRTQDAGKLRYRP